MNAKTDDKGAGQCPFNHTAGVGRTNRDWWPNQLRLDLLHQHSAKSDPMGSSINIKSFARFCTQFSSSNHIN